MQPTPVLMFQIKREILRFIISNINLNACYRWNFTGILWPRWSGLVEADERLIRQAWRWTARSKQWTMVVERESIFGHQSLLVKTPISLTDRYVKMYQCFYRLVTCSSNWPTMVTSHSYTLTISNNWNLVIHVLMLNSITTSMYFTYRIKKSLVLKER